MSYSDAKDAVSRVMQCIADSLGMSDDEFDSIGHTVDVLFALGFRSHMLDGEDQGHRTHLLVHAH